MKQLLLSILLLTALFSLKAQSVTVTQPNGGEVLYGCQSYQIKWNATGVTNNWNIDYSMTLRKVTHVKTKFWFLHETKGCQINSHRSNVC